MNLTIGNPNRFPHIYALDKLGGDRSPDGEKYYEEHEKELEMEFTEIMKNVLDRDNLGDNKKIHNGCSNRR
jgi:hypothetical protein